MFTKISIILTVLILTIKSIENLETNDLCVSTSPCKEKHSSRCTIDLCALNAKSCNDYKIFKSSLSYRSLNILINFQKNIKICESSALNRNNYCLNNLDCFKQHYILTRGGFREYKKRINCNCNPKIYSFECGDYCALSEKHCEFLNMKIKYPNEKNATIGRIQKCF